MLKLEGKYATADVYTRYIEQSAQDQIIELCDQPFVKGASVKIMPDTHAGTGCVIGFTADLGEKVIPNIVGVDIGCGVHIVELRTAREMNTIFDFERLDGVIRANVPSGFDMHNSVVVKFPALKKLRCYKELKTRERIKKSLGTLGGGNHFIEVAVDVEQNHYLVVHTGSRNLGKQVADIYQKKAEAYHFAQDNIPARDALIKELKAQGRQSEIQERLKEMKYAEPIVPKHLSYLEGQLREDYLHDMYICQEYGDLNRKTILEIILKSWLGKSLKDYVNYSTVHNYINPQDNIIRKGAISAHVGEKVVIPINMRDGSLLCLGKGNKDWNYSAPHGAGRLMSRGQAKANITLEDFQDTMHGVYTTSVGQHTIDEAPQAYKPLEEILEFLGETVEVLTQIKPVYNFKSPNEPFVRKGRKNAKEPKVTE